MNIFEVSQPKVKIEGGEQRFPVRRIYCVGRNYAAHSREMGADPDREAPFFFLKATDTIVEDGARIAYPPRTNDLHHEVELVVAIGAAGRDVAIRDARSLILGYAVGIDFTRRDLQSEAKNLRRPWDTAKTFDGAAAISALRPSTGTVHPESGRIWLSVNDRLRQDGDLRQLIWSVPETIAELSTLFALAPGDLVYTGTPAGVAAVVPGDRISAAVEGIGELHVDIC